MGITAVIKKHNRIVANTVSLTQTQSNPTIELRSNLPGISQNYLHTLLDVVEQNPRDGYTLIFNETLNKYEVKPLELNNADIDGGSF